jgi:hypothetical protein
MADGSTRAGRSSAGPLLLAVIFLAVLGAGAGFSLGTLARDSHASASTDDTSGQPPAGDDHTPDAGATTGGTPTSSGGPRCPAHTEQQAGVAPLTQLLHLHTAQSEVWICQDKDGTLYYQGHKIINRLDEELVEGTNALFLFKVDHEGDGYVATNTDPSNGHVTRYHVTRDKLIIEYVWSKKTEEQDAV